MHYGYSVGQCLVTAGWVTATFFGLLALWATAGRFRWYWHIAPLALALAALVPMGGYQPLLIFGSQAAAVVLCCLVVANFLRRRDARSQELPQPSFARRFTLRDGVLATVLLASVLAVVRNVPYAGDASITLDWWRYSVTGFGFATITCAARLFVASRPCWYWRVLPVAVLLIAGIVLLATGHTAEPFSPYFPSGATHGDDWKFGLSLGQFWLTAIWLFLVRMVGWHGWPSRTREARRTFFHAQRWPKTRRAAHAVTCLALLLVTFFLLGSIGDIYWHLLPPSNLPTVALPDPNGIDDLEPVEQLIQWTAIPTRDPDDASDLECGAFVLQNAEAIQRIRQALEKPWMRRVDFHDPNTLIPSISAIQTWQRVLFADARYQLSQGRADLAAQDYLDVVRLGSLCGKGGASLDATVADAIRGIGNRELAMQLDQFDANSLREIAYTLDLASPPSEPLAAVFERDLLYLRYSTGWIGRLHYWAEHEALPQRPSTEESVMIVRNRTEARQRLLMLEAAIRAYQSRHHQIPPTLDALVPDYLGTIPRDPFDPYETAPLIYRRQGEDYLLYSVGHDRYDDGGLRASTPDPQRGTKRDLFFDSPAP